MHTHIATPPITPAKGGLLDAATILTGVNPIFTLEGVTFELDSCGVGVQFTDLPCNTVGMYYDVDAGTPENDRVIRLEGLPDGTYTVEYNVPNQGIQTFDIEVVDGEGESDPFEGHSWPVTITLQDPEGGYPLSTINVTDFPVYPIFSGTKTFDSLEWVQGEPFMLYKGIECYLDDWASYETKARRALELGKGFGVESRLWELLGRTGVPLDEADGTSRNDRIVSAIAALENYAALNYAGVPLIHIPRYAMVYLAAAGVLADGPAPVHTHNGSLIVAGAGYGVTSGALPGGDDTVFAMAITGQVVMVDGDVTVSEAPAPEYNRAVALAEQGAALVVECIAAYTTIDKE